MYTDIELENQLIKRGMNRNTPHVKLGYGMDIDGIEGVENFPLQYATKNKMVSHAKMNFDEVVMGNKQVFHTPQSTHTSVPAGLNPTPFHFGKAPSNVYSDSNFMYRLFGIPGSKDMKIDNIEALSTGIDKMSQQDYVVKKWQDETATLPPSSTFLSMYSQSEKRKERKLRLNSKMTPSLASTSATTPSLASTSATTPSLASTSATTPSPSLGPFIQAMPAFSPTTVATPNSLSFQTPPQSPQRTIGAWEKKLKIIPESTKNPSTNNTPPVSPPQPAPQPARTLFSVPRVAKTVTSPEPPIDIIPPPSIVKKYNLIDTSVGMSPFQSDKKILMNNDIHPSVLSESLPQDMLDEIRNLLELYTTQKKKEITTKDRNHIKTLIRKRGTVQDIKTMALTKSVAISTLKKLFYAGDDPMITKSESKSKSESKKTI